MEHISPPLGHLLSLLSWAAWFDRVEIDDVLNKFIDPYDVWRLKIFLSFGCRWHILISGFWLVSDSDHKSHNHFFKKRSLNSCSWQLVLWALHLFSSCVRLENATLMLSKMPWREMRMLKFGKCCITLLGCLSVIAS